MSTARRLSPLFPTLLALCGCAGFAPPQNLENVTGGTGYQAQYRAPEVSRAADTAQSSAQLNAARCLPKSAPAATTRPSTLAAPLADLRGERLSRNDLLDLRVAQDETFSGAYVVSRDGTLKLPFLAPIPAEGRHPRDVETDIAAQLQALAFFGEPPRVSVRVTDLAAVRVGVAGAVFAPGALEIGTIKGADIDARRQAALGASGEARTLSAALRLAGGVRPDADLSAIELRRTGALHRIDLRGVFDGSAPADILLLSGDEIRVPSRGCFQEALMRPSPISPPGVSVFLSNLTQPSHGQGAIGRDSRATPYGTRYLEALISTNCVGGTRLTSTDRSAALVSRNPITGASLVIERDIEALLRRADRDEFDPYLLPGDSIVCYDGALSNLSEVGRIVGLLGVGSLF